MRKITSHYCLSPNGSWIKRPIIELDNDGKIISLRETGDHFAEEPGLEYFPGIIIPSFVLILKNRLDDRAFINQCIVKGTRRVITYKEISLPKSIKYIIKEVVEENDEGNPWEQILKAQMNKTDLATAINEQSTLKARQFGLGDHWGAIKEGSYPGLLLLQGVDLKTFSLSGNTKMKVLVD